MHKDALYRHLRAFRTVYSFVHLSIAEDNAQQMSGRVTISDMPLELQRVK
jgi:hypothetical protein